MTSAYPSLVRRDAARWLAAYRRQASDHWSDSVGLIAAWAADEYTLGRATTALRYLDGQARAGHLNSALSPRLHGMAFVTRLRTFLHAHGHVS